MEDRAASVTSIREIEAIKVDNISDQVSYPNAQIHEREVNKDPSGTAAQRLEEHVRGDDEDSSQYG